MKRDKMNECYYCDHVREVPGNAHVKCVKPDSNMSGEPHGIKNGWFMYPDLFDPTWKKVMCRNFKENKKISN